MSEPNIPLSIYLHFPWCVAKCPYCDFNSFANKDPAVPEQRYVDVLLADLEWQRQHFSIDQRVISVFMGGGTPSLFSPEAMARIIETLRRNFLLADQVEITMEANPGTLERGRFRAYREAGINRVSLGVQSFDDAQLKRLGRIHSSNEARIAAEELHAAGLTNFNLDLMYGLPEQSVEAALQDVAEALRLEPAHLSHYQLTIEPGTPLAANPPPLPDDDATAVMLDGCQNLLGHAGFSRYEVSAYARADRQCQHNLNYWRFGDYLGVGAGAHGKISGPGGVVRTQRLREPRRYLAASPQDLQKQVVTTEQLPFEFLLNTLRLVDGFTPALFEQRTGLPFEAIKSLWNQAVTDRLVESGGRGTRRATPLGYAFMNDLLARFLPDRRDTRAETPSTTRV